jgi:hypothetical protein
MVEKVVMLIFSSNGIFQCIEQGYIDTPVCIVDVLSKRAKMFLPPATELLVLKKTVFANLSKLEDVLKKTKALLEKYKLVMQQRLQKRGSVDLSNKDQSDTESKQSKHSHATSNQSKFKVDFMEVTD